MRLIQTQAMKDAARSTAPRIEPLGPAGRLSGGESVTAASGIPATSHGGGGDRSPPPDQRRGSR